MAYGTRESRHGGSIRTFTPDDTKDTIYINACFGGGPYSVIKERIQEKWPGITDDELLFGAEHINTDCIGYDKYDPSDYSDYIVITASKDYFLRMNQK